jgi:hypothetical protein
MVDDTKFLRVFGSIFGGVGSIFIIVGAIFGYTHYQLVNKAVKTQGTVIDLKQRSISDDAGVTIVYLPIIKFNTLSGEQVIFTSNTTYPKFNIGEQVEVIYNPQNTSTAKIDDELDFEWFLPVFFVSFGSIFAFVGGIVLLQSFKPRHS